MASNETKLVATPRTDFGKGAARRTRRDGRVPAVIYGHSMTPLHVSLPGHETMMSLKHRNAVIEIDLDGALHVTLAKAVQRDAIRGTLEHIDLVVVRRDEQVEVDIPIAAHGAGTSDTIVTIEHPTITVSAPATDLPEGVEVDVTGFTPGTVVLARDLVLPDRVVLITDPETVIIAASAARGTDTDDEDDDGDATA